MEIYKSNNKKLSHAIFEAFGAFSGAGFCDVLMVLLPVKLLLRFLPLPTQLLMRLFALTITDAADVAIELHKLALDARYSGQ